MKTTIEHHNGPLELDGVCLGPIHSPAAISLHHLLRSIGATTDEFNIDGCNKMITPNMDQTTNQQGYHPFALSQRLGFMAASHQRLESQESID
eukprot:4739626-Amphidinium_carterae.1